MALLNPEIATYATTAIQRAHGTRLCFMWQVRLTELLTFVKIKLNNRNILAVICPHVRSRFNQRKSDSCSWSLQLAFVPSVTPLTPRIMGPTWGAPGDDRTQVGPVFAPWTLLSGPRTYWYALSHLHITATGLGSLTRTDTDSGSIIDKILMLNIKMHLNQNDNNIYSLHIAMGINIFKICNLKAPQDIPEYCR